MDALLPIAAVEAGTTELVVLGILVASAALVIAGQAARIPYPVVLVLGGLALGFAPGCRRCRSIPTWCC